MKAKYGIRALAHMAQQPTRVWNARAIAEEANVPLKFLETILLELRQNGLIESKRGLFGGHKLAKAPEQISIAAIIRVLDGMIAPIQCASPFKYAPCEDCENPLECEIRHMMIDVRNAMSDVLDKRTLADLEFPSTPAKKKVAP